MERLFFSCDFPYLAYRQVQVLRLAQKSVSLESAKLCERSASVITGKGGINPLCSVDLLIVGLLYGDVVRGSLHSERQRCWVSRVALARGTCPTGSLRG